jgi:Rieske Fe-S protein
MERRDFVGACALGALSLTSTQAFSAKDMQAQHYARSLLVDPLGNPFKLSALKAGENYVFHYPFETTPCFLLNLGKPTAKQVRLSTHDGQAYEWQGGVGPKRSVVAFSAICSHKMTYPTKQVSFISFQPNATGMTPDSAGIIHCCSDHSRYDPVQGAQVISGPAPQPLCAILLEHDAKADTLHAVGTLGGEMFRDFFAKFEMQLVLNHGGKEPRRRTDTKSIVEPLTRFCKQAINC